MKIKTYASLVLFFLFSVAFIREQYSLVYPNYFPKPAYNFELNPLMQEKIDLGQALFYDPILSKDSTISCASCHSPYNGFAHTDHDLSHGIDDRIGTRNAPALVNLAWQTSFMWDGAINHLDMQSLAPISHPDEMGETLENVVEKLQRKSIYPPLFQKAYGVSTITGEHVLKAMAQFQLTLVSSNSKYDFVKKGEETFSNQEENGYQLFKSNCNSCHTEPLFTNTRFANNGLQVDTTLNDYGKWNITKQSSDSLLFKIPTLRNLSFTFPYMHDGRFRKLHQVLKHYTENVYDSETLDPLLENKIHLTSNEKTDLIAFLLTLNDKSFIFDQKHQYPKNILHPNEGFK